MENEEFVCLTCEFVVKNNDEYCLNCGTILTENKKCNCHHVVEAEGICLICLKLCCQKCGLYTNGVYLCNEHSNYEIIEGMARVYGSNDSLELEYYKDILEKECLHPFLYSRKSDSILLGDFDYSLYWGEFNGKPLNEIKLMLPLNEVIEAENILEPLIDNSN